MQNQNSKPNIVFLIKACKEQNRGAQFKLYELFYSYGISIAKRYAQDESEAKEILQESFIKVFSKLDKYDTSQAFKPWFRVLVVHTAIDFLRRNKRLTAIDDVTEIKTQNFDENLGWDHLVYEDVIKEVQKLSIAYRTVFNLYAIEGFKHHEIAEKLDISVGTSKSNYAKARKKLQEALKKSKNFKSIEHGRKF